MASMPFLRDRVDTDLLTSLMRSSAAFSGTDDSAHLSLPSENFLPNLNVPTGIPISVISCHSCYKPGEWITPLMSLRTDIMPFLKFFFSTLINSNLFSLSL